MVVAEGAGAVVVTALTGAGVVVVGWYSSTGAAVTVEVKFIWPPPGLGGAVTAVAVVEVPVVKVVAERAVVNVVATVVEVVTEGKDGPVAPALGVPRSGK